MTLLFVAIVLLGLFEGELKVPSKGFRATQKRETNPVGFYALAAVFAAVAALCAWFLAMLLRGGPRPGKGAQAPSFKPQRNINPGTSLADRIQYHQEGRSGHVIVELASGRHAFYWEFE